MRTPTRVALVTTDLEAIDEHDHDVAAIVAALADRGVEAVPEHWRDTGVDWCGFDLVVIRSPWDYPEHLDAFLTWMSVVGLRVPMRNCPATIRWNLDKSYLVDLADAGVPIVPTVFCDDPDAVVAAIEATDAGRVVVKPNVSAGSRDSGLFDRADPAARYLGRRILDSGRRVLVQPAIEGVSEIGEHGLVCFDGRFSHAFTKGPILAHGGGFLGGRYTEHITVATASDAEIALAERAGAVIAATIDHHDCGCGDPTPLYARFDVVAGPDGPLLLEAELFEPAYFLQVAPEAAETFADAVVARAR